MQPAQQSAFATGVPAPASAGWPPAWETTGGQLAGQEGGAAATSKLPSATQLDYANKLITTTLLVLALPALLSLLLTKPGSLLAGLGGKHLA